MLCELAYNYAFPVEDGVDKIVVGKAHEMNVL